MDEVIKRIKASDKIKIIDTVNSNNDGIVDSIIELYRKNKLVPVICNDMFEYEDAKTGRQSLHSYIVEEIIKKSDIPIYLSETELNNIVRDDYYGISLLENRLGNRIVYDQIYEIVIQNDSINAGVKLKKEVLDFLKICQFPLIITTNCFGIIEKELDDYRYNSKWNVYMDKVSKLPEKCVFHMFGQAEPDMVDWGYNEKNILMYLSSFEGAYPLDTIKTIIAKQRKTLLVLGNNTPDWMFRFIIKNIYGGDVYDKNKGYYLDVKNSNELPALNLFLKDIQFDKNQLETVLQDVLDRIKKIKEEEPVVKRDVNRICDFFVAHASEDIEIVENLVGVAKEHQLDVWVDYTSIHDGNYWSTIINGIDNSKYFVPVITQNYIQKVMPKEKLSKILKNLNINIDDKLTPNNCLTLENNGISGVQIELLLATYKEGRINDGKDMRDTYSLPILIEKEEYACEPIDIPRINRWSEKSKMLPQYLFGSIQRFKYDKERPEEFEMEWDRYK